MKSALDALRQTMRRILSSPSDDEMDPELIKGMARQMAGGIMTTRPDEIGCAECFEQMDQFVEINLAGKDPAEAMPMVQDHLNRCSDCREEFEALLVALQTMN